MIYYPGDYTRVVLTIVTPVKRMTKIAQWLRIHQQLQTLLTKDSSAGNLEAGQVIELPEWSKGLFTT